MIYFYKNGLFYEIYKNLQKIYAKLYQKKKFKE